MKKEQSQAKKSTTKKSHPPQKPATDIAPALPPKRTPEEEQLIAAQFQGKISVPRVKSESSKEPFVISPDSDDTRLWLAQLYQLLGSSEHEAVSQTVALMQRWMWQGDKNPSLATNVLLATIASLEPRDSTESLLALQMAVTHHTALEMLRRVLLPNQTIDGSQLYGHRANQLLRTFTTQLETLLRYRGGGQQKVIVEHVHVNAGGQAIVGTVQPGKRGEGVTDEK